VAWAAVVLGGLLLIGSPRHLPSVAQLVVATLAAAGGLVASLRLTGHAIFMSPFNRGDRPGGAGEVRTEIDRIRARLSGRRVVVAPGILLPPEVIRLLQPLIAETAERAGVALDRLPPRSRAVVRYASPEGGGPARGRRPNKVAAAAMVHAVLDELERLDDHSYSPHAAVR